MPIDVLLDSTTGDLARVTRMANDFDADPAVARRVIAQHIRRRILTAQGTWLLDQTAGLPLVQWMQGAPDLPAILLLVRREVEGVRRVVRTQAASITHDRTLRKLTISMQAVIDNGTVVALTVLPFGVLGNPTPLVTSE